MTGLKIAVIALALFTGMLCFAELGRRVGQLRDRRETAKSTESLPVLEGSVFGLMGLLVALTFSASATRFEMRRQVLVDEANAIGTAWLRIDLLPEERRSAMREEFRLYADSRLAFHRGTADVKAATHALRRTTFLQGEIWSKAVTACDESRSVATTTLFLPALNTMIDLTTSGTMLAMTHLPLFIRALLVVLPLFCAFLGGLESAPLARRVWTPTLLFALMLSATIFVILDLDYPRVGLVRVDLFDQALVDLRTSMGSGD